MKTVVKDLAYYKANAEEDYLQVPISVLRYISQLEQVYSEEDMKQFGDWCRNALLNTEYGFEKLDKHLEQWKQFKKK